MTGVLRNRRETREERLDEGPRSGHCHKRKGISILGLLDWFLYRVDLPDYFLDLR